MRTQKHIKTESLTFMVPAKSSPSLLCVVAQSWGQGPAAWGTRSTQGQEKVHGGQLVHQAPQLNTESQSCMWEGQGRLGLELSCL